MKALFAVSLMTISTTGFAKGEYQRIANCASAEVANGDTCSNVKVRFDFHKCEEKLESKTVEKVSCEGKTITARTTIGNHRFEAKFTKNDDGWGAINWEPKGEVKTFKKKSTMEEHAMVSPEPVREPAKVTPFPEEVSSPVKWSGFFDFRSTHFSTKKPTTNEREYSGFLLEDGALYITHTTPKLSLLVDLAFSRNKNTATDSSELGFAKAKSQLLAKYKLSDDLSFGFGQFDTFYGVELTSSKDRVFGNAGLVYNQALPVVHAGAFLEYSKDGFMGRLMVANPSDRESLGTDPADSYHEYGATLGYSNEHFRSQLGYLQRARKDLAGEASERSLMDVTLGATLGPVDIDLEYALVKDPSKNTLTTDPTDVEDSGSGALILLAYKPMKGLTFGGRYEWLAKDPGGVGYDRASAWGANSTYKFDDNVTGRIEYISIDTKRDATTTMYPERRFDIGALISF